MEIKAIDYDMLFDIEWDETQMNKESLMESRCISPNHAMTIVGVHLDHNKLPIRWKVQNSWGKEQAYLVMSNEWFNSNVFEIVVPSRFVDCEIKNKNDPKKLKPWDILSTVAKNEKK